jgi:hypothetical protein
MSLAMIGHLCVVLANPDIAGLGVRTSIYAQTLLSFAPPLIFGSDGVMDSHEESILQTIYTNLLLTSFAMLISAFIQVRTLLTTIRIAKSVGFSTGEDLRVERLSRPHRVKFDLDGRHECSYCLHIPNDCQEKEDR